MAQKPSRKGFVLTSVLVIPADWEQFRALVDEEGTTAGQKIRAYVRREIRRAVKRREAVLGA